MYLIWKSQTPCFLPWPPAVPLYFTISWILKSFLTSLLTISQILGMPLPMKDYVCFSKTHLWSFFLILPGSKILQCFPWIFSWVLIHKLNHFHRVYVLKSQPHELILHWGVDSCFSKSYTQENASLLWASQESQSHVSKWYVQLLLLYLKRATVEYSGFSVHHVIVRSALQFRSSHWILVYLRLWAADFLRRVCPGILIWTQKGPWV